jgi:hypothetical protein
MPRTAPRGNAGTSSTPEARSRSLSLHLEGIAKKKRIVVEEFSVVVMEVALAHGKRLRYFHASASQMHATLWSDNNTIFRFEISVLPEFA